MMDTPTSNSPNQHLTTQLSQELDTRYSLRVSPTWLADFLSTVKRPAPPLPALASTANFRLLSSDYTQSLVSDANPHHNGQHVFPRNITDVHVKQLTLQTAVPVQVLAILDLGVSKYAQIEAIERVERGEEVRGREVIRNVPIMNDENDSGAQTATTNAGPTSLKRSAGPHKLLLQDAAGTTVWGFELVVVPKVFVTIGAEDGGLSIGAKMSLRPGVVVRRGMIMLEPRGVTLLGGKVEEWDRKWRVGRKQRLIEELKRESEAMDGDG